MKKMTSQDVFGDKGYLCPKCSSYAEVGKHSEQTCAKIAAWGRACHDEFRAKMDALKRAPLGK